MCAQYEATKRIWGHRRARWGEIAQAYLPHPLPPSQWSQLSQIAVSVWLLENISHISHRGVLSLFRLIRLSFPGSRTGFSIKTSQHSASYLPLVFKLISAHLCVGTHVMPVPEYVCLTANRKTKRNRPSILHYQGRSFSYLLLWKFWKEEVPAYRRIADLEDLDRVAGSFCGENSEPARYIYETVHFIDIVSFVRSY